MLKSMLEFNREGSIVEKKAAMNTARANMVYVQTKYSTDGRNTDGFYVGYSPDDHYALYLLEYSLNSSETVSYYCVYDDKGNKISSPDPKATPKRI